MRKGRRVSTKRTPKTPKKVRGSYTGKPITSQGKLPKGGSGQSDSGESGKDQK